MRNLNFELQGVKIQLNNIRTYGGSHVVSGEGFRSLNVTLLNDEKKEFHSQSNEEDILFLIEEHKLSKFLIARGSRD